MSTSSVSFRITRHTEDLAQTIHALTERVVSLEQRLTQLEDQLTATPEEELPEEQVTSLAHVDQLLRDCRELLAADPSQAIQPSASAGLSRGFVPMTKDASSEDPHTLDDVA
ncbi:MAG: hypothetical protein RLZZ117_655 [Cyanobacteriota bacterium]|jgi:hypothetical protein